jgi:hypothetical protein
MGNNGNGSSNCNLTQTHMSEEALDFVREHAVVLAMAIQDHGIGKIQLTVGLSTGDKISEWCMTMERVDSKYMVQ